MKEQNKLRDDLVNFLKLVTNSISITDELEHCSAREFINVIDKFKSEYNHPIIMRIIDIDNIDNLDLNKFSFIYKLKDGLVSTCDNSSITISIYLENNKEEK